MPDPEKDLEFIKEFEQLLQEVESVIREYPPELRDALRDEARVALRLQLQERWEAAARAREEQANSETTAPRQAEESN